MEIAEVLGLDYDTSAAFPSYKLRTLYRFEFEGYTSDGKAQGQFVLRDGPSWLEELQKVLNYQPPQFWQK